MHRERTGEACLQSRSVLFARDLQRARESAFSELPAEARIRLADVNAFLVEPAVKLDLALRGAYFELADGQSSSRP